MYLDLIRVLKKTKQKQTMEHESDGYTNCKIVIGVLGIVTKGLVQVLEVLEIRGRVETIQTTALLRSARILSRVLGTWGDLWEKSSAKAGVKNSQKRIMIIIQKHLTLQKCRRSCGTWSWWWYHSFWNSPWKPGKTLVEVDISKTTKTIKTTAVLKSVRILWRVLDICVDLLSLRLKWKTTCQICCEELVWNNNNNNNTMHKVLHSRNVIDKL